MTRQVAFILGGVALMITALLLLVLAAEGAGERFTLGVLIFAGSIMAVGGGTEGR